MHIRTYLPSIVMGLVSLLTTAATAATTVVSNAAVHNLISELTRTDPSQPALLIPASADQHHFALKPSQRRLLDKAQLVLWLGAENEPALARIATQLPPRTRMVNLLDQPTIHTRLTPTSRPDPHVWLDPINAIGIINIAATELGLIYPQHQSHYQAKATEITQRLKNLDQDISEQLEPLRSIPFVVQHDAFRYLVERYHLNQAGVLNRSHDRAPSLRHTIDIEKRILDNGIRCLINTPQENAKVMNKLATTTSAQLITINPLPTAAAGTDYIALMTDITQRLVACLGHNPKESLN